VPSSRIVDGHRFDADSDPYPTPSYTQVGKSEIFFDFNSQQCQFTLFCLSRQCHRRHNFRIFTQIFFAKMITGKRRRRAFSFESLLEHL
jgi:hypothetical protein